MTKHLLEGRVEEELTNEVLFLPIRGHRWKLKCNTTLYLFMQKPNRQSIKETNKQANKNETLKTPLPLEDRHNPKSPTMKYYEI